MISTSHTIQTTLILHLNKRWMLFFITCILSLYPTNKWWLNHIPLPFTLCNPQLSHRIETLCLCMFTASVSKIHEKELPYINVVWFSSDPPPGYTITVLMHPGNRVAVYFCYHPSLFSLSFAVSLGQIKQTVLQIDQKEIDHRAQVSSWFPMGCGGGGNRRKSPIPEKSAIVFYSITFHFDLTTSNCCFCCTNSFDWQ